MSVKVTGEVFTVSVSDDGTKVSVAESPSTLVSVSSSGGPQGAIGPIGPTGPQGIQGVTGPRGAEALLYYRHEQATSSATWDITHNLNFFPNVTVVDSAGAVCEGEIEHITINRVRLTFSGAFSGNAYLS